MKVSNRKRIQKANKTQNLKNFLHLKLGLFEVLISDSKTIRLLLVLVFFLPFKNSPEKIPYL